MEVQVLLPAPQNPDQIGSDFFCPDKYEIIKYGHSPTDRLVKPDFYNAFFLPVCKKQIRKAPLENSIFAASFWQ
ncbi:hypothetical protein [Anaeromassilibacillus senegalensis]|uniref:hypothetical protein n=1 Tax=Anaeromassilibacillus senegalensis TaxID=1673717 RepID=UPI0012B65B28|nr:hypothetical protein [Anaeromassilibacillus senegalensis]